MLPCNCRPLKCNLSTHEGFVQAVCLIVSMHIAFFVAFMILTFPCVFPFSLLLISLQCPVFSKTSSDKSPNLLFYINAPDVYISSAFPFVVRFLGRWIFPWILPLSILYCLLIGNACAVSRLLGILRELCYFCYD